MITERSHVLKKRNSDAVVATKKFSVGGRVWKVNEKLEF